MVSSAFIACGSQMVLWSLFWLEWCDVAWYAWTDWRLCHTAGTYTVFCVEWLMMWCRLRCVDRLKAVSHCRHLHGFLVVMMWCRLRCVDWLKALSHRRHLHGFLCEMVNDVMSFEMRGLIEGCATQFTLEWFLTGVDPLMLLQVAFLCETLETNLTPVRFLSRVSVHVIP